MGHKIIKYLDHFYRRVKCEKLKIYLIWKSYFGEEIWVIYNCFGRRFKLLRDLHISLRQWSGIRRHSPDSDTANRIKI